MKVRTVTYFLSLSASDFKEGSTTLSEKLDSAAKGIAHIEERLSAEGYELQTKRLTFNSWTEWIPPIVSQAQTQTHGSEIVSVSGSASDKDVDMLFDSMKPHLTALDAQLSRVGVDFCSLGACHETLHIALIPSILGHSPRFNCNVRVSSTGSSNDNSGTIIAADNKTCIAAAEACLAIHNKCGDNGNFRYCIGFDTNAACPYFPASFWDNGRSLSCPLRDVDSNANSNANSNARGVAVGLENGDLLFLAAAGTSSVEAASMNLHDVMRQVLLPIQKIVRDCCRELSRDGATGNTGNPDHSRVQGHSDSGDLGSGTDYVYTNPYVSAVANAATSAIGCSADADVDSCAVQYLGIDASINPGLSLPDSVGAGLEHMLYYDIGKHTNHTNDNCTNTGADENTAMKTTITGIDTRFGQFGTLNAVSAVTAAIKKLAFRSPPSSSIGLVGNGICMKRNDDDNEDDSIKLCGYSGLMLPVMEDCVLAARASGYTGPLSFYSPENAKALDEQRHNTLRGSSNMATTAYSLRDLLTFSTVCGVGLDTVPISGDANALHIAAVYAETSALAFRLQKPLSVRLLPMAGKKPGDRTNVGDNPYLTDTTVFSLL